MLPVCIGVRMLAVRWGAVARATTLRYGYVSFRDGCDCLTALYASRYGASRYGCFSLCVPSRWVRLALGASRSVAVGFPENATDGIFISLSTLA